MTCAPEGVDSTWSVPTGRAGATGLAPFFDPDVVVRFGRVWSAFDKYGNPTYAAPPNAATPAARTSHFAADGPSDRPTSATRPARDGCGGIGAASRDDRSPHPAQS